MFRQHWYHYIKDYIEEKNSKEKIIARDKTSLDITWLKDKSFADLDNLPDPGTWAEEL